MFGFLMSGGVISHCSDQLVFVVWNGQGQSVRECYDPTNKDTYCHIQDKGMPTTAAARVTMAVHQLVDVLFVAAAGPIRVWYYL